MLCLKNFNFKKLVDNSFRMNKTDYQIINSVNTKYAAYSFKYYVKIKKESFTIFHIKVKLFKSSFVKFYLKIYINLYLHL